MSLWQDLEKQYYMQVVRRQPITIVKGQGTKVWDDNNKEYLDFTSGWAVNNLGHCHPAIVDAIKNQAETLLQTSNQFFTIPQVQLAQILVENSCLDRVFFANSGAEANEGAVKLARKYGKINKNGAYGVITALNSFHGRTMAMISATGQPHYQANWQPLYEGFTNVEYNNVDAIKQATNDNTCAVMLEPIQGEGGVNIPDKNYFKNIKQWCESNNLLLILDEVQTGIGRTGTLFGYEQFDVEPDVITLAKGLGGGVPIGAFLAKNALTCAAAFGAVKFAIENNIAAEAKDSGEYLKDLLEKATDSLPNINDIRGKGLLIAVEFTEDIAPELVSICNELGLLLNPVRPNAIRLMPPLTVNKEEMDKAVDLIVDGIKTILAKGKK
jgi:acetylornithine/N-succinyldiaminopimelate aminotransferase